MMEPSGITRKRLRLAIAAGIAVAMNLLVSGQRDATVLVRGGTFRMGTAASAIPELKRRYAVGFPGVFESETPDHVVTLSDFRIDRYEVTNARFARFLEAHAEWNRERVPPGRQLIKHQAERENVRGAPERLATGLFGRHVRHGPEHHLARADEGRGWRGRGQHRDGVGVDLGTRDAREAEVEHFDVPVHADHHVLRLDVAMDDAGGVGHRQRARHLPPDLNQRLQT